MLTIRNEQMEALARPIIEERIERAVEHIQTSLPDVFEEMGRADVRASIVLAIRKAEQYGLEDWSEVLQYVTVMYILGFEFDEDPRYPWAHETLTSDDLASRHKVDLLLECAVLEAESANGTPLP